MTGGVLSNTREASSPENRPLRFLELFAGSRSIGKAAERRGHDVISVDIEQFGNIDIIADIHDLTPDDIRTPDGKLFVPDVVWSGTPCTTYSIAGIGHHRNMTQPTSEFAAFCDEMNIHVMNNIIDHFGCLYYIENPRGMLRKMPFMRGVPRTTVCYCRYGDNRMKPTDVFSNNIRSLFVPDGWQPRPMCHNENPHCHHDASPRGSKTGTQGRKNAHERSKMPDELCDEIIIATEHRLRHLIKTP